MPRYAAAIDTSRIPVKGLTPESAGTAPSSPVVGQLWTDTSVTPKVVRTWDGSAWVALNAYAGTTAGTFAAGNDTRITGAEQTTNKGAASGYAPLDASTRLPAANLPVAIPAAGLSGATTATRYVGGTTTGAPTGGTFVVGDFVVAQDGRIWVCTTAGTPGTWTQVGAVQSIIAGTGIGVSGATGNVTVTNNGVTSAVAGTNVTVSGATGAVTFGLAASPTFTGTVTAGAHATTGLTGAVAASRYVGATASGAPATGSFSTGDFVIDQTGNVFICTAAGTPGTWIAVLRFGTTSTTAAAGNDARIVGAEQTTNKGAANGYASLDGTTKVPVAQLPTGTGATNVILGNDARLSDQRVPTDASVTGGTAGAGVKIAANTITDANVAAANKDGVAGTASLRTLGTGAQQAAAGNDARLSDQRVPTDASVTGGTAGTGVKIAANTITLANMNASTVDAAAATGSLRTLGTGGTQALAGNTPLSSITAPSASVNFNGQRITNLGAPVANTDAARLADVQSSTAGIDLQPSVRAASTGNVVVATGGLLTIDGVTLVSGDRVLLKNQTTASENGVYIAAAGAWSRAADTITANTFWFAEEGTVNADTQWMVTNNGTIVVGTTPLTIAQFGAATSYIGTANRITVTGTTIDIAATYTGQTSITTLGTVTSGTWNGTVVGIGYGGTGATTPAGARTALGVSQTGYAATLGAVTPGTPVTITHNLGTQDVIAQVRDASTNEYIYGDIINASTNTVTFTSGLAYAASALRIVVLPVA